MIQSMKDQVESTVLPLLGGIIEDSQTLLRQEIALAKSELRRELTKAKNAAAKAILGAMLTLVALICLSFMLVHLIADLISELSLWQCFGTIGVVFGVTGLLFLVAAKKRFTM